MNFNLKSGEITREEYFEWKINWPQTCDGCRKYEPKKQWRKNLSKRIFAIRFATCS